MVALASSLWDADRVQFDGAAKRLRKRRVNLKLNLAWKGKTAPASQCPSLQTDMGPIAVLRDAARSFGWLSALAYAISERTLERDELWLDRHPALAFCLSMIFSENRIPLFRIML